MMYAAPRLQGEEGGLGFPMRPCPFARICAWVGLRGLANLSIVPEGSVGYEVSVALSRLARQEFASQAEGDCGGQAAEVIAEIVVPSLMEASGDVSNEGPSLPSSTHPTALLIYCR